MIKVAIIGYGYWGPNLFRNFMENQITDVSHICDIDKARLKHLRERYPSTKVAYNYMSVLKDNNIQIVAVATPVLSHYKIARDSLLAGKHVLIEKPMTSNVKEASMLLELAEKKGLTIFVDHTYIFTGAIRTIKKFITHQELGSIYYFDSVRVNLGLFQHDINVLWDLAPHDLSIMDYLVDEKPISISAIGSNRISGELEEIAYITVRFESGLIAHFHVNWISPVKIRRIIIGGSKKMVVFDDLEPDEKVKIYDKGVTLMNAQKDRIYKNLIQYRIGDMHSPNVDRTEALKTEVSNIVDCILNRKSPIVDGTAGLRVVKLLEAAQKSLKKNGALVKI